MSINTTERDEKSLSKKELAEKVAAMKLPTILAFVSKHSVIAVVGSMWSSALVSFFVLLKLGLQTEGYASYLYLLSSPVAFVLAFVITGIVWARLAKRGVIEGKFPRTSDHPVYAFRRIYGTAWTQIFYFKPLYAVCLAVPLLKRILLRGFGYTGDLGVIVYPDTWIRDLPLLKIEPSVYLSNRATIGTNMCMNDGSIIVGDIHFKEGSMVGHLATIAPGVKVGVKSEIGVGTGIGIRTTIGDHTSIAPRVVVNHACKVGNRVVLGNSSYLGVKSVVADHIQIKDCAVIPPGSQILTQEDADQHFSTEKAKLIEQKDSIVVQLQDFLNRGGIKVG